MNSLMDSRAPNQREVRGLSLACQRGSGYIFFPVMGGVSLAIVSVRNSRLGTGAMPAIASSG